MNPRFPLITLLALAAGCAPSLFGTTVGSGNVTQETRKLSAFKTLNLSGATEASVKFGSPAQVVLYADDNLLPLIETSVVSGVLRIEPREQVRSKHGVRAEITVPSLEGVDLTGASSLDIHGLSTSKFKVETSGASTVKATGSVTDLQLIVDGASVVELERLVAQSIQVDISGASTAKVFAKGKVQGEASGASNLSVSGDPQLVVQTNGASNVTKG